MLLHRKLGAGGWWWGGVGAGRDGGERRRNCMSYNKPAVVLWEMWGLLKNVAILYFRSILSVVPRQTVCCCRLALIMQY